MTHPNPAAIAAQLAATGVPHPSTAAAAWAAALRHLDPEGLQAIAATMPFNPMGDSLRHQLEAFAEHLNRTPLSLGK